MPVPLLPLVVSAAAPLWNGVVNAFNGASGRTMQQNLEGQRLAHQKELQEKQIVAQFEIESVSYTHLTLPTICSV